MISEHEIELLADRQNQVLELENKIVELTIENNRLTNIYESGNQSDLIKHQMNFVLCSIVECFKQIDILLDPNHMLNQKTQKIIHN